MKSAAYRAHRAAYHAHALQEMRSIAQHERSLVNNHPLCEAGNKIIISVMSIRYAMRTAAQQAHNRNHGSAPACRRLYPGAAEAHGVSIRRRNKTLKNRLAIKVSCYDQPVHPVGMSGGWRAMRARTCIMHGYMRLNGWRLQHRRPARAGRLRRMVPGISKAASSNIS